MSKDKKEIFGAMLAEYQKLQKLEKQYPTLAEAFAEAADAKLFGQIRATLDKKIADLLAAQAAKIATTTAAPEPSPDDEPNINKASFKEVLQSWAGNQQKKFSNTTMLIKSEDARRHLNCSASSLSIFVELRGQLLGIFEGKDAMSIADISTELIKISDVYRKKDDKGFEELFKKDKKDYKAVSEPLFVSGLAKLDPAAWLTEEAGKGEVARQYVVDLILLKGLLDDSIPQDLAFDKERVLKNWDLCVGSEACGLSDIRRALANTDDGQSWGAVKSGLYPLLQAIIDDPKTKSCELKLPSNWALAFVEAITVVGRIDNNESFEGAVRIWAKEQKNTPINTVPKDSYINIEQTKANIEQKMDAMGVDSAVFRITCGLWLDHMPKEKYAKVGDVQNALTMALNEIIRMADEESYALVDGAKTWNGTLSLPPISSIYSQIAYPETSYESYKAIFTKWAADKKDIFVKVQPNNFSCAHAIQNFNRHFYQKDAAGGMPLGFIGGAWYDGLNNQPEKNLSKSDINKHWNTTLSRVIKDDVLKAEYDSVVLLTKANPAKIDEYLANLKNMLPSMVILESAAANSLATDAFAGIGFNQAQPMNAGGDAGDLLLAFQLGIDGVDELVLSSNIKISLVYDRTGLPCVSTQIPSLSTPQTNNVQLKSQATSSTFKLTGDLGIASSPSSSIDNVRLNIAAITPAATITHTKEGESSSWAVGGSEIVKGVGGVALGHGLVALFTGPLTVAAALTTTAGLGLLYLGGLLPAAASTSSNSETFVVPSQELNIAIEFDLIMQLKSSGVMEPKLQNQSVTVNGKKASNLSLKIIGIQAK